MVDGGANRFIIVLNDNNGVTEITQSLQRGEQSIIVTLMQAN